MNRRTTSNARSGFTLTEILVASALMGFLAVVTWSLFNTYRDLFMSGIDRSAKVRIARALAEQFTDDLHSAIQESAVKQNVSLETSEQEGASATNQLQSTSLADEPTASSTEDTTAASSDTNESGESITTRRFGLFGSSHTLRLDVLQVDPRYVYRLASQATLADSDNVGSLLFDDSLDGSFDSETDSPVGKAAELRTIEYTFTPKQEEEINAQVPEEDPLAETSLDEAEELERPPRPGLIRRELSFDVMLDQQDGSLLDDIGLEETDPEEAFDPNECYLPEVVDLSFRYYDGSGWTTSWDSLTRKSLPVAVEITFCIQAERRKPRLGEQASGTSATGESSTDVSEDATVGADVETGEVNYIDEEYESYQDEMNPPKDQYRVLITLPTSAKYPGVRAESDTTFETTPEPFAPRALQTPKLKNQQKPKADERWMRSNEG